MLEVLRTLALRLALCLVATGLAWKLGGLTSALWTTVLYGIALARPLIDLASELRHLARRRLWHDVEGRHYSFRGHAIRVLTDLDHRRWVRLADVRAVVGFTASDAALRVTYPGAWQLLGRPPEAFVREDALITHLAKERAPEAAKLRHWAEREIAFPGRRERERLGITEPRLDPQPGDGS